jgi:flagellar biosynthetic protein FliR
MTGFPPALVPAVLVAMRVTGLMLIAPVFSSRTVPASVRVGLTLALTVVVTGALNASGVAISVAGLASEMLVGVVIGLGAAILVSAAEFAGDLLATEIGLSGASTLDPLNQSTMPVLGQFTQLFMVMLLLGMDGHLVMLGALRESFGLVPLGGGLDLEAGLPGVVGVGSVLFARGLQFAAPVVAAVTLSNVGLGVLARTVPQLNVLMVAFPIQIAVGLATLGLAIPYIAAGQSDWPTSYAAWLDSALTGLRGR